MPPVRDPAAIRELRIGSYNLKDFFGRHPIPMLQNVGRVPNLASVPNLNWDVPKSPQHLLEEARAILESGFDIVVVQEAEQKEVLEEFSRTYLGDAYRVVLVKGNDPRNLDIGFLVKRDLPLEFELRTHREERWLGHDLALFSRDLPVLVARVAGHARPVFALVGTHYKSKHDYDRSDSGAVRWRTAQIERTVEILAALQKEFGADLPLILAGDFNGNVHRDPEYARLHEIVLKDVFDLIENPLTNDQRSTHFYFPDIGHARPDQPDAILVSKTLQAAVFEAFVYRYRFADGHLRPPPRDHFERNQNPSDHFPIGVALDFQFMLRLAGIQLPR